MFSIYCRKIFASHKLNTKRVGEGQVNIICNAKFQNAETRVFERTFELDLLDRSHPVRFRANKGNDRRIEVRQKR